MIMAELGFSLARAHAVAQERTTASLDAID